MVPLLLFLLETGVRFPPLEVVNVYFFSPRGLIFLVTGVVGLLALLQDSRVLLDTFILEGDTFLGDIFLDPDHPQIVFDTFKPGVGLSAPFPCAHDLQFFLMLSDSTRSHTSFTFTFFSGGISHLGNFHQSFPFL